MMLIDYKNDNLTNENPLKAEQQIFLKTKSGGRLIGIRGSVTNKEITSTIKKMGEKEIISKPKDIIDLNTNTVIATIGE